jgi:hypothetical protein
LSNLPTWPADLPYSFLVGTWQSTRTTKPVVSEMNAGTSRRRRKYSLEITNLRFTMQFQELENDLLKVFFETIGEGAAQFRMPLWNGAGFVLRTCAFRDGLPAGSWIGSSVVRYSFDLLVENL